MIRATWFFAFLAAGTLGSLAACGSKSTGTTAATTTTGTTTTTTAGAGGGQTGPNCPGFAMIALADFVDGCIHNPLCEATPVDKTMCKDTVDSIKNLSEDFKKACEMGPSGTGGNGSGGSGAGGMKPGNMKCTEKCTDLYNCAKKTGQ